MFPFFVCVIRSESDRERGLAADDVLLLGDVLHASFVCLFRSALDAHWPLRIRYRWIGVEGYRADHDQVPCWMRTGASYPIGGASEIPYQIIPVIQSAGGRVLVKAPVTEILTDAGRTVGVRVSVGTSGHCDVLAPVVISDAGRSQIPFHVSTTTKLTVIALFVFEIIRVLPPTDDRRT